MRLTTLPRLDLGVAPETIAHPLARDIVEKLQALRRQVNATTPHALLSQAVDVLRVRPILLAAPWPGRAGTRQCRSLPQLQPSLRGAGPARLRRGHVGGLERRGPRRGRPARRPGGGGGALHHARRQGAGVAHRRAHQHHDAGDGTRDSAVTDRASGRFYCPVFGVAPTGHEAARDDEGAELDRERVRLWYVAATRARELLVLPQARCCRRRLGLALRRRSGTGLAARSRPGSHLPPEMDAGEPAAENEQTRKGLRRRGGRDRGTLARIVWRAPSRDEDAAQPVAAGGSAHDPRDRRRRRAGGRHRPATIQGGRERGTILHKLIEEVLTGETAEERRRRLPPAPRP